MTVDVRIVNHEVAALGHHRGVDLKFLVRSVIGVERGIALARPNLRPDPVDCLIRNGGHQQVLDSWMLWFFGVVFDIHRVNPARAEQIEQAREIVGASAFPGPGFDGYIRLCLENDPLENDQIRGVFLDWNSKPVGVVPRTRPTIVVGGVCQPTNERGLSSEREPVAKVVSLDSDNKYQTE